jgi:O-antigen/teichoic acid export membrane protein
MGSIRTSFFWALGQNYIVLGIQFVASMIVARLLTPREMGIFSVAVVIVGFANILRDFGVGDYIVQEKDLTRDRIKSALAVNVGLAWLLAFILFVGAWPAAEFFREPGVKSVMQILSLNFLLVPFGSVPMAIIRRDMNFAVIAKARVLSGLTSAGMAVLLAYYGESYRSMAWGAVAGSTVTILISVWYRPERMPFMPGIRELKRVLSFGTFASGTFILSEIDKSVTDLILGRTLGMGPVGIFGRAQGLVQLIDRILMNSVWAVALPYFAQKDRAGTDVLAPFLRTVSLLTGLVWPFAILLGTMAYPVIRVLFGTQWDDSIPLVRILCLSLVIGAPFQLLGSLFLALGKMRPLMAAASISVVSKLTFVLIGAKMGLPYVAIAYVAATLVSAVIGYVLLRSAIGLRAWPLVHAMMPSGGIALLSALGPIAVVLLFSIGPDSIWIPLLVAVSTSAIGWGIGVIFFNHPLKAELRAVLGHVGERWSEGRSK